MPWAGGFLGGGGGGGGGGVIIMGKAWVGISSVWV